MKRLYRRYFVLLDTEDYRYGFAEGNPPKGYAKVEVKNDKAVLSVHCQSMKKLDEKNERYRIFLLKVNNINAPINIELGPIEVDDRGTGEAVFEFNSENVKGSKTPIDDFDAIVVFVDKTLNKADIIAPLVGYVHKEKIAWKNAFNKPIVKESSNSFIKEPKKETQQLIFEKKPKQETMDIKLDFKIDKDVNKPDQECKIVNTENTKERVDISMKPTSSYSFEEDSEDVLKYQQESINAQSHPQINHIQYYIESTLKLYPKVNPFEKNLSGYEWWQIYHNQQTIYRAYMPFIAYLEMMNNPHQYHYPHYYPSDYYRLIYMYQHYLFGICYDEQRQAKYFVYAIPGRKMKEEQPFGGNTGFVYWKSCMQTNEEGIGYWMLHIDPMTGLVVEPMEKTMC
ncbi:hypothetical protein [Serpentinicella alkaliphila]|uniref:Transmembrane protein n=1 Tax=Serpentinicella alkaliphila TaxID=1734049 RepID=A0A4R2TVT6_9FIRM|nr:hypothetical protein [Serpentinicella alkaliphila]QUH25094.1 hypothetical protein HZR23_04355 [Serpentinicella alkaliphila]TCQ01739.1 hypothetical protein EDD79_102313 [Serpentinicella alkaliphila]